MRERRLENSKLAKYIKMCHEIDTHVENNVKCRGVAQKSRKRDSEKCACTTYNKNNMIMTAEPKVYIKQVCYFFTLLCVEANNLIFSKNEFYNGV